MDRSKNKSYSWDHLGGRPWVAAGAAAAAPPSAGRKRVREEDCEGDEDGVGYGDTRKRFKHYQQGR